MQHVRIFYIAREVSLAQHQLASPRCHAHSQPTNRIPVPTKAPRVSDCWRPYVTKARLGGEADSEDTDDVQHPEPAPRRNV